MNDEPLTIPPGTHRISETILMTTPSWKSVMRTAFGTGDQQLGRGGEAVAVPLPLLPKRALTLAQELLTRGVQAIKADSWDVMYEQGAPQRVPELGAAECPLLGVEQTYRRHGRGVRC